MVAFAKIDQGGRVVEAFNRQWTDSVPEGMVEIPIGIFEDRFNHRYDGNAWVLDPPQIPLASLKKRKIAQMDREAEAQLALGYADGNDIYPLTDRGVMRLNAQVTKAQVHGAAKEPYKLWASDANGDRVRLQKTAAQLTALATSIADYVSAVEDQLADRLASIKAATTVAEVEAITWGG